MNNNKTFNIETIFEPPAAASERYGLSPVTISTKKAADLPFYGLEFCCRYATGEMESFLVADKGKVWDDTLAKKIYEDTDVKKGSEGRCRVNKETGETKDICVFSIIYENKSSSVFKPTVHGAISNAVNVETEFTVEFLFCFDGGFLLPLLRTFKTSGTFSIGFHDAVQKVLDDFEGPELYDIHLKESENVTVNKDGISILCSSEETGAIRTLEFGNDGSDRFEIRRAFCSARIIALRMAIQ